MKSVYSVHTAQGEMLKSHIKCPLKRQIYYNISELQKDRGCNLGVGFIMKEEN